jgi:hypothetical protein
MSHASAGPRDRRVRDTFKPSQSQSRRGRYKRFLRCAYSKAAGFDELTSSVEQSNSNRSPFALSSPLSFYFSLSFTVVRLTFFFPFRPFSLTLHDRRVCCVHTQYTNRKRICIVFKGYKRFRPTSRRTNMGGLHPCTRLLGERRVQILQRGTST